MGFGAPSPRIARSTASMASFPAQAGADAFHEVISPFRDWRVEKARCTAWLMAW